MKDNDKTITISEFKATCLAVLDRVKRTGRPITVTRHGEPIAQVIPPVPKPRPEFWLGCMEGTATICGDIVAPATDPEEWEMLKG